MKNPVILLSLRVILKANVVLQMKRWREHADIKHVVSAMQLREKNSTFDRVTPGKLFLNPVVKTILGSFTVFAIAIQNNIIRNLDMRSFISPF